MLYLIGLGLSDEKDVTVRGLEAIKGSDRIYLEAYTSILGVGKERLVSLLHLTSLFGGITNCALSCYRSWGTRKNSRDVLSRTTC